MNFAGELDTVQSFLASGGFRLAVIGGVARDDTAERLFQSVRQLPGPGGHAITVPKPEYLAAMKVQAIKEAPERTLQDLADVAYLLQVPGVERDEVKGYLFEPVSRSLA